MMDSWRWPAVRAWPAPHKKIMTFTNCREEATNIELCRPVLESLLLHWDCTKIDERLLDLTILNQAQSSYNIMYEY